MPNDMFSTLTSMTIGERIKAKRRELGMSGEALGLLVGVTKSTVSQWENGDVKNLRPENLIGTADALDVSVRWLVYGKDSMSEAAGQHRASTQTHQPVQGTASEVHQTIARLYSELGVPMIDIEAMKRAYRAVDKLFATRPGFGPDVKAAVLAAAYEETLRDAEAAETAVKNAMQRLTQGSNVKKRRTRAPK